MPTIDENLKVWARHDWSTEGEEWSLHFGGSRAIWEAILRPRIGSLLPAAHLLEIATGYGRMTQHLLRHCARLTGVDLCPAAVEHCRVRFRDRPDASFAVVDGKSLPEVGDGSIDFAFSWDSLVHVELDAMEGYVAELARVLRPGGAAFLHHSNVAAVPSLGPASAGGKVPHWRGASVSAAAVAGIAARAGLGCRAQELIQWGDPRPIDAFTLLERPREPGKTVTCTPVTNPDFRVEMRHSRRIAETYLGPLGLPVAFPPPPG